jgi:predicted 2-oxoglutarate/Fe(II)-dependent dioxygenase YbiX
MSLKINNLFAGELKPDVTIAGCIDIFENAWPNPLETISQAEEQTADSDSGVFWERAGTVGRGVRQQSRTNKVMAISLLAEIANNPALQNIHNQLYALLLASTNPYASRYNITEPFFHEDYQLLKYTGGEEYKAHYDGHTEIGRTVSAIVYLNDDYEGGEIEFVNFKVKIKPKPGMLILFPSNFAYSHIAYPVTKGTKYALVTWIKDRRI